MGLFTFIILLLATLINCLFVWFALMISRLRTYSFGGMYMLSAAVVLPVNLIPGMLGMLIALGAELLMVRSVTNATSWVDSLKYIAATMVVSIALVLILLKLILGHVNISEAIKGSGSSSPTAAAKTSVKSEPRSMPGESSYNSLSSQLSAAELAEIERKIAEPLPGN
ncbi:MAG: hypothetical protein DCC75_02875 [Proteobacteria bacterium]|nr:MAG: hypothetical protein DCC75_02875 [Pseudomonadota bacterium]